jgi:hypothetical protein
MTQPQNLCDGSSRAPSEKADVKSNTSSALDMYYRRAAIWAGHHTVDRQTLEALGRRMCVPKTASEASSSENYDNED